MNPSVVTTSADTEKVAMIRAEMPAVTREVYLNAGTNGPLPRRAVNALIGYAQDELDKGRIGQPVFDRFMKVMTDTRQQVADLLACTPEEVALTHNTTEGMNIALWGIDWKAGDEVITAGSEHEGGLNPVAALKARYGVKVVYTDIGLCDCDPVESLEKALTPKTRAVVLSHVSWATGAVLPMRELSEMAHRVGALVICDAAQACGMVLSNMSELGVDAYAISGQKWLCGPDGTGALYVKRELIPNLQNTFTGYWGLKSRVSNAETEIQFRETAERYQVASHYFPSLLGFGESLRWIREDVGWDWVYQRSRELGQYAYNALSQIDGLSLYLPVEKVAGLLHFKVEGVAPPDLTARLFEKNILIRHTPDPVLNRVATGFYNNEADIDKLVEGIRAVR